MKITFQKLQALRSMRSTRSKHLGLMSLPFQVKTHEWHGGLEAFDRLLAENLDNQFAIQEKLGRDMAQEKLRYLKGPKRVQVSRDH